MKSSDPEDQAAGEALYRNLLPLVVFMIQSLENFLTYGKLLAARRYGIRNTHPRGPSIIPTTFGLECLHAAAAAIWPDLMRENPR